MTLEQYIARLNSLAFWKEFTFTENGFTPRPGAQFELADNLVWLDQYAIAIQLKQRTGETKDPEAERTWFHNKVLKLATRQVRDTITFLQEHEKISITNERGHSFDVHGADLAEITKVVVFLGGRALPEDCWKKRYHISSTAGFIHVLAAHDYLGILEKLRVPEDIRRYFKYREAITQKLSGADDGIDESDIMGAFLNDADDLPSPQSREVLRQFVQDLSAFDLSPLLGSLHEHIEGSAQPYDYYRILLEFARVPRSVWRALKVRFTMALEAVQQKEFTRPFRVTFPDTDCAFMICALDPQVPATGHDGERTRIRGLQNFTYAAMYDSKVAKGIGIMISKDGDYLQIDWALLNVPWEQDPEMDTRLAESNPFREAKEQQLYSFLFKTEGGATRHPK
jgi:hypothetical protein